MQIWKGHMFVHSQVQTWQCIYSLTPAPALHTVLSAEVYTFSERPVSRGQHGFFKWISDQLSIVQSHQWVTGGNHPVCFNWDLRYRHHFLSFPVIKPPKDQLMCSTQFKCMYMFTNLNHSRVECWCFTNNAVWSKILRMLDKFTWGLLLHVLPDCHWSVFPFCQNSKPPLSLQMVSWRALYRIHLGGGRKRRLTWTTAILHDAVL